MNCQVYCFLVCFQLALFSKAVLPARAYSLSEEDLEEEMEDNPQARLEYEQALQRNPRSGLIPPDIRARELAFSAALPIRQAQVFSKSTPDIIQVQNWTHRGPWNAGGRTRALAMDVANEKNLLAGGVSGGMWRSIDGGKSWVRTTRPEQLPSVTCIAQDRRPGKTNVWYYGTGEQSFNSASADITYRVGVYRGDGIFKSTDNGLNWAQLPATVSSTPQSFKPLSSIWRIVTDSHSLQDIVYAAAVGGIYRSIDGGGNWQLVLGSQTSNKMSDATDIAITSQGVLYATLGQLTSSFGNAEVYGIYRSTDGIHWTKLNAPLPSSFGRIVPAIAPSNENSVLFLTAVSFSKNSLFRYTYLSGEGTGQDGKWENRSAFLPAFGGVFGNYNSQGGYNIALRVDPSNENIVYLGGTNLYRSTNGFSSSTETTWIGGYNPDYQQLSPLGLDWHDMMYPNHHSDIHGILILPSDHNVVLTASDGGVSMTLNAAAAKVQWQSLNNGYLTTQFYAIAINQAKTGDRTVIGGMQDNNTLGSDDPSAPWKWLAGSDGGYCAIPDDNSIYYVSSQSGHICRTKVNAQFDAVSLEEINFSPSNGDNFRFLAPLLLDPNNNSRMYIAAQKSIWRNDSVNGSSAGTVKQRWKSLSPLFLGNEAITALSLSRTPADILFCGTNLGKLFRMRNASASAQSIENISGKNFPFFGYIQCVAVDPDNADHLFVVFSNYEIPSLFVTEDGGKSWKDVSGNLEEHPDGSGAGPSCRWAEIIRKNGKTLYLVGTSTGLYSTTNLAGAQTQWLQEGATSIGNVVVSMIRSRSSDGFIAIGTHGNGVFTTALETAAPGKNSLPETVFLEQNYPNPAHESTTIRYSIPKQTHVLITICDALGKIIAIPVNATMDASFHMIEIQTGEWPDGTYFLHLEADGVAQTRLVTVRH